MKLSKSLLQAILVGITIGSTSSCTIIGDIVEPDTTEGKAIKEPANDVCVPDNCPACGMG